MIKKVDVAKRLLAAAREKENAETREAQRAEQQRRDQLAAVRLRTEQEVLADIAAIFETEFQPIMEKALANRESSFRLDMGDSNRYSDRLNEAIESLGDRPRALAKHMPTYLASEGFSVTPGFSSNRTEASTDPEYSYPAYWTTRVWVDVRIPH